MLTRVYSNIETIISFCAFTFRWIFLSCLIYSKAVILIISVINENDPN